MTKAFMILGFVLGILAMGVGGRMFFRGAVADTSPDPDGDTRRGCSVFVIGFVVFLVFINVVLQ